MRFKNSINWFEIPVNNLTRAIEFYESVFDITLTREKMDNVELAIFPSDKDGITGALIKADFLQPSEQGSLVYLNAEGVMDEVMARAEAQSSSVFFPKTCIGECGYVAHIGDSEGNKIALHSMSE
ncbi:hypothetical protein MNBD_GAMMA07-851 [hydrothermal vent metagenome]|uniref:VOC domain-containing protein n=1 Tax=hydrothermal vent metagenome TaxID=652676 RepID=A0A3B0XKU8_9ZZZZ